MQLKSLLYLFDLEYNKSLHFSLFLPFICVDTWGGDVVLDVVPGPNGGSALKSSSRGWYDRTQSQILNVDCVNAGDRIAFSAKIKSDPSCLIYSWDYGARCNNLMLYTDKNGLREYHRVGYITADTPDADGW